MDVCFVSDVGKVRKVNEDSGGIFYNTSGQLLTVIADGMGGHQAGNIASQIASTQLKELWEKTEYIGDVDDLKHWLNHSISIANEQILEHAQDHQECLGMGTTIVATVFLEEQVVVSHVGDSRLYYISEEHIQQITEDHSFVQQLVKTGELTPEEAEAHPKKNVLMHALGTESEVYIDVNTFLWNEDDYVLLCSDGLSNKMTNEEIHTIILSDQSISDKVNELVQLANENGGEDNISVILIQHKAGETS